MTERPMIERLRVLVKRIPGAVWRHYGDNGPAMDVDIGALLAEIEALLVTRADRKAPEHKGVWYDHARKHWQWHGEAYPTMPDYVAHSAAEVITRRERDGFTDADHAALLALRDAAPRDMRRECREMISAFLWDWNAEAPGERRRAVRDDYAALIVRFLDKGTKRRKRSGR